MVCVLWPIWNARTLSHHLCVIDVFSSLFQFLKYVQLVLYLVLSGFFCWIYPFKELIICLQNISRSHWTLSFLDTRFKMVIMVSIFVNVLRKVISVAELKYCKKPNSSQKLEPQPQKWLCALWSELNIFRHFI